MAVPDDRLFQQTTQRVARIAGILGIGGVVGAFLWGGWSSAAGFALGATASWLAFRGLKRVVGALGTDCPAPRLGWKSLLRYLMIAGAAYVIVKYTVVDLRAGLVGLFLSTAAVLVEILIELIYARN
jgi:hypothetical protein